MSLSVCGVDGVVVEDGDPGQLAEPMVFVDLYSCSKCRPHRCVGEHHEGVVGRDELRVDPLLRTAAIQSRFGPCVVDVQYWATSPARPHGGLWEYHGLGGLTVEVGGNQVVTRGAEWTGRVCEENLAGRPGEAWLWRGAGASVARYGGSGGHDE